MPTWLWILIGIVAVIIVLVAVVMIFTKPRQWPDDEAMDAYMRMQGLDSGLGRDNPTCPSCGTIYNRDEVVRQLKQLSPEMFSFGAWSTRFRCKTCQAEVGISGSGSQ